MGGGVEGSTKNISQIRRASAGRGSWRGEGRGREEKGRKHKNSFLQKQAMTTSQEFFLKATPQIIKSDLASQFKYFLASLRLIKSQQVWYIFGGR